MLRNGEEIGRAKIGIENAREPLGTHAYTVLAGGGGQHPRWSAIGLPGHAAESGGGHDKDAVERLRMPRALTSRLYPLLESGTTMLVTDAPVLEHTTGANLYVMRSGLPDDTSTSRESEIDDRPGAASVESILIN